MNLINRLKFGGIKIFSKGVDVHKTYEDENYDKIYEVSSTLKNKKSKINNILIEKYKNKTENPDFEQNSWSKTATGVYKIGHDSIRLMK